MTLSVYIVHQLRELRREVLAAVDGLSQDDICSHDPGDHWPIAWILQHLSLNVDRFLYSPHSGSLLLDHEENMLARPRVEPKPGDPYPLKSELTRKWNTIMDAAVDVIESLDDAGLNGTPPNGREPVVESCLRVINHTNAHLRAVWCILGQRRIDEKYPEQDTWLA